MSDLASPNLEVGENGQYAMITNEETTVYPIEGSQGNDALAGEVALASDVAAAGSDQEETQTSNTM